jgi:hypothetical protein
LFWMPCAYCSTPDAVFAVKSGKTGTGTVAIVL